MNDFAWLKRNLKTAATSAAATSLALLAFSGQPASAADIIFAPGLGAGQSAEVPSGEQQAQSGVVQIALDDGTVVSIVAPARYSIGPDGSLTVASGSFTAVARQGSAPLPIRTAGGTVTLRPGSSFNAQVSPSGQLTGFALAGRTLVMSNGRQRSFLGGTAFQAQAGQVPAARMSAGVQPNAGTQTAPNAMMQLASAQPRAGQHQHQHQHLLPRRHRRLLRQDW